MSAHTHGQTYIDDIDDLWTVQRSSLDRRVWVPFDHDGDMSCFMAAASSLRLVKCYVEESVEAGGTDLADLEWIKDGPDRWLFVTHDDARRVRRAAS